MAMMLRKFRCIVWDDTLILLPFSNFLMQQWQPNLQTSHVLPQELQPFIRFD
jgi:hypothetical protein